MIHFDEFSWRFAGAASWALREVSLHIGPGEFVAIAGPSGSGKTTLALAMCGLLIGRQAGEAAGSVCVAEQDVAAAPLHEVAERIGLVQQNPEAHFATLTVNDELAFGMENRCLEPDPISQACTEALELLSIPHLRERALVTLSGGEKQRVAVASMVAGKPAALVLDEPTASLDPSSSRELFRALADLCRRAGLAVIVIEHKLAQLLPLNPRLICLDEGRVVLDAPHADAVQTYPAWLAGPGPAEEVSPPPPSTPTSAEPIVDVSQLFAELEGRPVLAGVNLRVSAGEVVAVLGPNGGGKSTLLHCLLGLVPATGGSPRVCGVEVTPTAVSRLARRVGVVFQNADHQLVADYVWQEAVFAARNLRLAKDAWEGMASRLIEQAGLADRKEDHPFRLSWGQKRRLNLISALLHKPQLLLLDEPFAGQDWQNASFLLDAMRDVLAHGAGACLLVTHDPRIVLRWCTRVLFVEQGRVTVDAPVRDAFAKLLELGHDAYVPAEYAPRSTT